MKKNTHPSILPTRLGLLALLVSATGLPVAQGSPSIQSKAVLLQVITAPTTKPVNRNCLACHTAGSATASLSNLKPGYQAAYLQDKTKLTQLKTLLNVLPTTTVGTANLGAAKTDIYEVICATGGVSLGASVKDLAPVKVHAVGIQVTAGASASTVSKDPVDGDANYSAETKLAGGANAVYSVKVTKDAYNGTVAANLGPETYTGQLACRNAANVQTGLAWRITQNQ